MSRSRFCESLRPFHGHIVPEWRYRMLMLNARFPRLWSTRGPVSGPGLEASRKVMLSLPSTVRYLM